MILAKTKDNSIKIKKYKIGLSNKGNNFELINFELTLFDEYQLISNIKILNNPIDHSKIDILFNIEVETEIKVELK